MLFAWTAHDLRGARNNRRRSPGLFFGQAVPLGRICGAVRQSDLVHKSKRRLGGAQNRLENAIHVPPLGAGQRRPSG